MPHSTVDHTSGFNQKAIVIIDNEPFSQDCLAQAMRGEFPQLNIIGMPSVRDLYQPKEIAVEAVLLKIQTDSSDLHGLVDHIRMIGRYFDQVPVIVISQRDDASCIQAAVMAGAQGVIPVTASFKIAVAAVRLVLAGGTYYPHPISARREWSSPRREALYRGDGVVPADVLTKTVLTDPTPSVEFLEEKEPAVFNTAFTAREVDVLTALRQGRSNKWIAHHLRLSENTIKVHIRHIMRKLHATNRTEAVVLSQNMVSVGSSAGRD